MFCVSSPSYPFLPPFPHGKQSNKKQNHTKPNPKTQTRGWDRAFQLEVSSDRGMNEGKTATELGPCPSDAPGLLPWPSSVSGWLAILLPSFLGPASSSTQMREPWCDDMMPSVMWEREDQRHTHDYDDTLGQVPVRSIFTQMPWLQLQITCQIELALLPVLTLRSG